MAKRPSTDDDKTTPFIREGDEPAAQPATPLGVPSAPPPQSTAPAPSASGGSFMVGNSFKAAKAARRMPRWALPLLASVIIIELGFVAASWASSIWAIDRLDRPQGGRFDIAIAPPPPPPPPPPKGGEKPHHHETKIQRKTVKDIVQPVKIEKHEDDTPEAEGDPNGEEGGVEGGVVGGVVGGVIGAPPPPPPPPPPPAPPKIVPPTLLEGQRIAGNKHIVPNEVTKTEIMRSGKNRIIGSFKLCITVGGAIKSITQLKSTGFVKYDNKIKLEMRQWRYRPYLVNGRAVPVCTAVTFVYSQH